MGSTLKFSLGLFMLSNIILVVGVTSRSGFLSSPLLQRWLSSDFKVNSSSLSGSLPWTHRRRGVSGLTFVTQDTGLALIIRGGARADKIVSENNDTNGDMTGETGKKRNPIAAFFHSWFDLSNITISDAPWEQGSSADLTEPSSSSPSTTLSQKSSRGGALVERPNAPLRNRFHQWLGPLDISRVAPSSNRLIQNDFEPTSPHFHDLDQSSSLSSDNTARPPACSITDSFATASAKSVRRLWWVDTWAEQLPDEDDEELVLASLNAKTDDTDAMNITEQSSADASSDGDMDDFSISDDESNESNDETIEVDETDLESDATNETICSDDENTSDSIPTELDHAVSNDVGNSSPYVSSGSWLTIDKVLSLGYSVEHPGWRISSHLRSLRKLTANITGLHGALSGKPHANYGETPDTDDGNQLGMIRRRLAAIERARRNIEQVSTAAANLTANRRLLFWKLWDAEESERDFPFFPRRSSKSNQDERQRRNRVKEIDKQMIEAQKQLQQLTCEKDVLQRSLNPLWNYTTGTSLESAGNESTSNRTDMSGRTTRLFNFPSPDLVLEYLDMLFSSGRLTRLNHTDLWRNGEAEEYDSDDEWLSPIQREEDRKRRSANGDSGSWLLRNVLGSKLGETTENAAYKSVCSALMSVLAKSISNLHGVNVMTYSDIRLSTEQAPALPTIAAGIIPGSSPNRNYAHEAFQDIMRRGARKRRPDDRRDSFVQREAVVETLTSQCQIAAPLLKLFPLAWQRALLSNIVIMATAVISDFCEGIEFQLLGHRLTFAFTPITEDDMIRGMVRDSFNNPRRTHPELFEAAVRATAESVGESLNFLDKWHERALGSDLLRTQIATLIARLVLTLTDDALCGSRLDLWAAHAGGPRLLAALEYRTGPGYTGDA